LAGIVCAKKKLALQTQFTKIRKII
jgi:hypothetical protein